VAALLLALAAAAPLEAQPLGIEVLDDQTGRGVPLVELTTTGGITLVTDSAGLAAFDEPGLMNQRVYFEVHSHGYELPADGFGYRGVTVQTTPGGWTTLRLRRKNIAQRLYRVTGQGIYRDSLLLGRQPPIAQPVLNAQVIGSDSVQNAIYRGQLYWFWGDTHRPSYPLGLFHVPGAVSRLPGEGGLPPSVGVDLTYFTGPDGFARATAAMPGEGPTWITGLTVVPDAQSRPRMLCGYVKVQPPLTIYRRGLAQWDDARETFVPVAEFSPDVPLFPDGHALLAEDQGRPYVYFANPYPLVRVPARAESFLDLSQYEGYTCLLADAPDPLAAKLDRDANQRPRFAWRRNVAPLTADLARKLIQAGKLAPDDLPFDLRDAHTGKPVQAHSGSVAWNPFRQRYVLIAVQQFGQPSFLGEVWYAEAPTPTGPWRKAVKIVTHDRYSFYNPKQHPYFSQEQGRYLYFEGTYTTTFSGQSHKTPRYDYNQIMYLLDLADKRLAPAHEPPDALESPQP
jgi:hypothetical protein